MCGQKAPGGVQRLMNVRLVWWWHARINGTVRIALGRAQNGPLNVQLENPYDFSWFSGIRLWSSKRSGEA